MRFCDLDINYFNTKKKKKNYQLDQEAVKNKFWLLINILENWPSWEPFSPPPHLDKHKCSKGHTGDIDVWTAGHTKSSHKWHTSVDICVTKGNFCDDQLWIRGNKKTERIENEFQTMTA